MPPSHAQSSRHDSGSAAEAGHTLPSTKPRRATVGVFSKRKGVRYRREDGAVLTCRFCEILRRRDELFLYEDAHVVVFRPLRPIVPSHVLIVPRAHLRNITMLTATHEPLMRRMKLVAERVLLHMETVSPDAVPVAVVASEGSSCPSDNNPLSTEDSKRSEESSHCTDDEDDSSSPKHSHSHSSSSSLGNDISSSSKTLKLAFHVPPFNSIDHVHMHAFLDEPRRLGVFGRLKYKTESWWCRSYDDVLTRLGSHDDLAAASCSKLEDSHELVPVHGY